MLEKDWPTLAPKLRGKLRIWVGEADDYFLNNAVHLLDDFLTKAKPAYEGKDHLRPAQGPRLARHQRDKQMMEEMAAAIERGRKAAGAGREALRSLRACSLWPARPGSRKKSATRAAEAGQDVLAGQFLGRPSTSLGVLPGR